jgi:4-diphosphocytidyl-2-C-methyl-D-erythritol kinase
MNTDMTQEQSTERVQRELACAKLTLSLRIIGVRDDGFHLIEAEMVSLDLADTLEFSSGDALTIVTEDAASHALAIDAGDNNLVRRALRHVDRTANVHLIKRIPAGGGLGGGSSDAAAVFRWAQRTTHADVRNAATLGADVSFCIRGGRARVSGIGELIEPLAPVDRIFTLCTPPFGVSTPAAYRAWDLLGGPHADGPNDLEPAALHVEPRLAQWRNRLHDHSGQTPVLAGSGSTWFVEGAFPGAGFVVAKTVGPAVTSTV